MAVIKQSLIGVLRKNCVKNRKMVKNMDEYEKRDKETAELVYRIMSWIEENVDLTSDEMCTVAKIGQKALEKY